MADTIGNSDCEPGPELPMPHSFAEIFQYLRLRHHLTIAEMARRVEYSQHAVRTNEASTQNPTMKTLWRYIMRLGLVMQIAETGVTIVDPRTATIIVRNWVFEVR